MDNIIDLGWSKISCISSWKSDNPIVTIPKSRPQYQLSRVVCSLNFKWHSTKLLHTVLIQTNHSEGNIVYKTKRVDIF